MKMEVHSPPSALRPGTNPCAEVERGGGDGSDKLKSINALVPVDREV